MIKVVAFEPWHLEGINLATFEVEAFKASGISEVKALVSEKLRSSIVFTILSQDRILAIAGIIKLWHGVGEATMFISQDFYTDEVSIGQRVKLAERLKNILTTATSSLNLWRVQASVRVDIRKAIDFVEWLGFKHEGIMEKFGPDKSTYIRYAWVEE